MLIYFYGDGCPHCSKMEPLLDQLEQDLSPGVQRLEVWHNGENAARQQEYDKNLCGGVPFFYNTESGDYICGETSYERLKEWAGIK